MNTNIILIGFMGSGKSTIGRLLSRKIDKFFLDTDAMIESRENQKIRDIFSTLGESAFRKMEQDLAVWVEKSVKNAIISTGGGMPTAINSFDKMGATVYLEIGFDALLERLKSEEFEKRPLFQNLVFAKEIFERREPIYQRHANLTVSADENPEKICEIIMTELSL